MKRLIVNADDFGLHSEVNKAVIRGYQKGCIRSTSLMPTGAAVEEASQLARENPWLGIGIHLTLVAENPLLPRDKVSTLLAEDGKFHADHMVFIKNYLLGNIDKGQLYAECEAQIARAVSLGLNITHLDSHQHLHTLPGITEICLELMKKYGIRRMRYPGEAFLFEGGYPSGMFRRVAKCGLTACAMLARRQAKDYHIAMPDSFFGMLAGGHMEEEYFMNILEALPEGTSEIMVHPGADAGVLGSIYDWQYHWEDELAAVTSKQVMAYTREQNIRLISFKELTDE